jgi:hypothetical protein
LSASRPEIFAAGIHWVEKWVRHRDGLDVVTATEILNLVTQPIASQFGDRNILIYKILFN